MKKLSSIRLFQESFLFVAPKSELAGYESVETSGI